MVHFFISEHHITNKASRTIRNHPTWSQRLQFYRSSTKVCYTGATVDFPVFSHLFQYLRNCTTIHFSLKQFYFVLAQFFCLAGLFPKYLDLPRCEFTAQSSIMVWLPQKSLCLQGLYSGLRVHENKALTPPFTNLRPTCTSCWALLEGTGNVSALGKQKLLHCGDAEDVEEFVVIV